MAYALLLFVPLSLALRYLFDAPAGWVFLTSAAAITVLADWIRRATEQLAERPGSTIGSLLNVSFGNTAELMLALFILRQANIRVVQAQITGSSSAPHCCFSAFPPWSAVSGALARPSTRRAPVYCRHCCSWW
jgi:Ca2+/H+ antiporter